MDLAEFQQKRPGPAGGPPPTWMQVIQRPGHLSGGLGGALGGGRSSTGDEDEPTTSTSDEPLPLELKRFLATGSGVKWLVDTVKDWPDLFVDAKERLEDTLEDTSKHISAAPRHLNSFVVREYKKLVRSEMGKRLISRTHGADAAIADPLSVPLYVVEDIVRLRVHQLINRNWRPLVWRLCSRATLMCGLINLLKAGAKRLARGRPRAERIVAYVCDTLLPTEFYGPVLGITMVVTQSVNELLGKG